MEFIGGCYSDIGNYREVNQDAIFVKTFSVDGSSLAIGAIFDGVGGMYKSERASDKALSGIQVFFDHVCGLLSQGMNDFDVLLSHLEDAMDDVNYDVHEMNQTQGERSGTTASVLLCLNDKYGILNVGDSRVYIFENDSLRQLTTDDTADKEIDGVIKHFLVNCVGKGEDLKFSTVKGKIEPGTFFYFSSDGFYHRTVREDVIEFVKGFETGTEDPDKICEDAVHEVMRRGEMDNVSVGMIYCKEE